MALVAYSDESDFSEDENHDDSISAAIVVPHKNTTNGKINSPHLLTGIDSIIDEVDLQTNGPENAILHDKADRLEEKLISFPSFPVPLEKGKISELNEQDIVDDVPTVNTWTVTKNLKNFDKSIQQSLEPIKIKKNKNKLQFILPSLAELQDDNSDDDHEDESQLARKKYKPSSTGTGLFAVLPKPKNTTSSLVPISVSRAKITKVSKPNKSISKSVTKTKPSLFEKSEDSDDGLETADDADFFSLNKPDIVEPLPFPAFEVYTSKSINFGSSYSKNNIEENESHSKFSERQTSEEMVPESNSYAPLSSDSPSSSAGTEIIDQEALLRLRGRRNRETVNVIDINADDALMSRHEWMTRSMSETKPTKSFSKKKDGNPTQLQRRKHQITYLAHQAQEREQDLQNTWGQNRYTKMQTQSKYGF